MNSTTEFINYTDKPRKFATVVTTQAPSLNQEIVGVVDIKVKNRCFDPIVLMMRERLAESGVV